MKKVEEKVIKLIEGKQLIEKNDKILVALSGGPDSIFLLYFLNKFKKKFNIQTGALHINHKLRGEDSDDDEKFCEKICKDLRISYYRASKNVKAFASKKKISVEEAGREIRYSELKKISKKNNYNKIATAHNSNDNVETVLLNLIKGTGVSGLAGIPVKRENIIRPILNLARNEILSYLNENKIAFRIDKSNLSNDYERNFLRNEIIPSLKKNINPSLENSIFNSSEIFRNFLSFINNKNDEIINKIIIEKNSATGIPPRGDKIRFPVKELKNIQPAFLGELILKLVKRNFSTQLKFKDISKINLLINSKTGKKVELSEKLTALREREEIVIYKNFNEKNFEPIKLNIGERAKINSKTLFIIKREKADILFSLDKNREYISADELKDEFLVRKWQKGDKFFPLGMSGSKKISDFLTEQKISSIKKKEQLLLINNKKIVWVIGLRIDNRFKLSDKTKKICELCLI